MRIKEALTVPALEQVPWERVIGNEGGFRINYPGEGCASATDALLAVVKLPSGFSEGPKEIFPAL